MAAACSARTRRSIRDAKVNANQLEREIRVPPLKEENGEKVRDAATRRPLASELQ